MTDERQPPTDPAATIAGDDDATVIADDPGPTLEDRPTPVPTVPLLPIGAARRFELPRTVHPLASHLAAVAIGVVATMAIALAAAGGGGREGAATGAVGSAGNGAYAIDGRQVGVPGAPLTIEIWADYQCPYCGLFTHGLEPTLLREYAATGAATIRFRDYAFLGDESIAAAVAARCADREGAFWRYHDLLYASQAGENQGAFAQGTLVRLAEFAGLDATTFTGCLADPGVAADVAAETGEGAALGVESTPTIRIIGPAGVRTIRGLAPLAALTDAIARVARGDVDPTAGTDGAGEAAPAASGGASLPTPPQ